MALYKTIEKPNIRRFILKAKHYTRIKHAELRANTMWESWKWDNEYGQETSNESVCALIFRGDKIIGVSRKDNHNDFGLIGGKVEPGESVIEALYRETKEETGLTITNHKLVFRRFDNGYFGNTFLCEAEGDIVTSETGRVKEVTWEELFNGSFGDYNRRLHKKIYGHG